MNKDREILLRQDAFEDRCKDFEAVYKTLEDLINRTDQDLLLVASSFNMGWSGPTPHPVARIIDDILLQRGIKFETHEADYEEAVKRYGF